MSKLLTIDQISANYGAIQALRQVSLEVDQGELVTLIGSNGAGKSTTLMCASRITNTSKGKISFLGEDISKCSADELVYKGMAQVPEGRKVFSRLTVKENLELGAYSRKNEKLDHDYKKIFDLFPILAERSSQLAGTLSGGEQQMLAIGRALMSRPKLLLLDEPSMGIAPILVNKIFEVISQLNKEGIGILLVEQNANLALKLAHRAYVLENGTITISGKAADLLKNNDVQQAYLGH